MALYSNDINLSFCAEEFAGALSQHKHRFVAFSGWDRERGTLVSPVTDASTQTGIAGVSMWGSTHPLGKAIAVSVMGELKLEAAGAVAANVAITCDAVGRVTAANSGDFSPGISLEAAGAAGERIRCWCRFPAIRRTF